MPMGETIVAVATPGGESALAVVRVSGPLCAGLADACVGPRLAAKPRRAFLRRYRSIDGLVLDTCLVTFFAGERSFTGEPSLEFSLHGNPLIVQQVVEDLLARGCRMAEPGEFTRTAFANGKLDLSQAEAVADLISARSIQAIQVAHRQLEGSVGRKMTELADRLLGIMAAIEAYIDFPEEDLPAEEQNGPTAELAKLSVELGRLIASSHYKTILQEGIRTVIIGEPNAGKSSLLNVLTGEDRAIVTAQPGTTRDFLSERILVGRYGLRLVDTAGLREAESEIEARGMAKTLEQVEAADLLLVVIDQSVPAPRFEESVMERLREKRALVIENKIDLPKQEGVTDPFSGIPRVRVSLTQGEGIESLREAIESALESDPVIPGSDELLVSARHAHALRNARQSIDTARQRLRDDEAAELVAAELRDALASVGEVIGKVDNEEMLDRLFQSFCIGK